MAVSAGADSTACAHFLKSFGRLDGIIHHNSQLLLEDKEFEEKARNLAESLHVPFYFERSLNKYSKGSVEAWCREERISFFEKWSAKQKFRPIICTAHNLNDCVESYLFNCFRGHAEFKPMPVISEFNNFTLIRPFVLSLKDEMLNYCKKNNLLQFVVHDPLNDDTRKTRNWIRKEIAPQIMPRINLNTVVKKIMEKVLTSHCV